MTRLKNMRTRLGLFLAVMGPGIVTAFADNDAGCVIRDFCRFHRLRAGRQRQRKRRNRRVTGTGHVEHFLRHRRNVVRLLTSPE